MPPSDPSEPVGLRRRHAPKKKTLMCAPHPGRLRRLCPSTSAARIPSAQACRGLCAACRSANADGLHRSGTNLEAPRDVFPTPLSDPSGRRRRLPSARKQKKKNRPVPLHAQRRHLKVRSHPARPRGKALRARVREDQRPSAVFLKKLRSRPTANAAGPWRRVWKDAPRAASMAAPQRSDPRPARSLGRRHAPREKKRSAARARPTPSSRSHCSSTSSPRRTPASSTVARVPPPLKKYIKTPPVFVATVNEV